MCAKKYRKSLATFASVEQLPLLLVLLLLFLAASKLSSCGCAFELCSEQGGKEQGVGLPRRSWWHRHLLTQHEGEFPPSLGSVHAESGELLNLYAA